MTSEIVIMNKEAVAMAADSALTVKIGSSHKIFTSANKIFALSSYHPVGIMIYDSAEIQEIPWATVIKMYRKKLGKKKFPKLENYATHFISFLNNNLGLFPKSQRYKFTVTYIYNYYLHLLEVIDDRLALLVEKKPVNRSMITRVAQEVIMNHLALLKQYSKSLNYNNLKVSKIQSIYRKLISQAIAQAFPKVPLNKKSVAALWEIATRLFFTLEPINCKTGINIAGFGETDIFPVTKSYIIQGILGDKLKYIEGIKTITFDLDAAVGVFAYSDSAEAFMKGIDPDYEKVLGDGLEEIFMDYPRYILEKILNLDKTKKARYLKKIEPESKRLLKSCLKNLKDYQKEKFSDPIVKVVAMLPKDELANMAEALVGINSFKVKVSMNAEIVGGPIDVAVISKGDGFIWIKRKHYFKPELNRNFFQNKV